MTDEREHITQQQTAWWKAILLPALVKDNGDTLDVWENKLKVSVMPDEFATKTMTVNGHDYPYIPSITILTRQQMNTLIEGSVAKLHEWGFSWVTLPDAELRK